jgi:hypothetical protein
MPAWEVVSRAVVAAEAVCDAGGDDRGLPGAVVGEG